MSSEQQWPTKGVWGAMPSAEYVDNFHEGLDSYHLHRWLDHKEGEPYEQWFAFFAEKEEVEEAADYLNRLEAENAQQRGLLEDGTKGMAILNGEIRALRAEVRQKEAWRELAERAKPTMRAATSMASTIAKTWLADLEALEKEQA